MASDSAGIAGYHLTLRSDPKVFRSGPFVIGYTDSFRMGQLIRFHLSAQNHIQGMDDFEFMVTAFIPSIRECLKIGGYARKDNEQESGGQFLVGYRGRLYEIDRDYQVGIPADNFAAIGCGAQVALGALFASQGAPRKRAETAILAAERFNIGVRGPIVIEELPNR
jgi:hypothetical protein